MTKLDTALTEMGERARAGFLTHLEARTSAEWLRDWLARAGYPVSTSTIKAYRKKVLNGGQ